MNYKYRFHNLRTGESCCAGDTPDYFCDSCKQQFAAATGHSRSAGGHSHSHPRVNYDGTVLRTTSADPYRAALSSRANERHAVLSDPRYWTTNPAEPYSPTGHAPNSYLIHLALRELDRQDSAKAKAGKR